MAIEIEPQKKDKQQIRKDRQTGRQERKEQRSVNWQAKKDAKKVKKDASLDTKINQEAGEIGIDIDTKRPISNDRKAEITHSIKQITDSPTIVQKIDHFADAYGKEVSEDTPGVDRENLRRSLRIQKRKKWADILYSFGKGLQGDEVDPNTLATVKQKNERKAQYEQYKDATQRNRVVKDQFEDKYREDLMAWIDKLKKEEDLDANELLEWERIEAELAEKKRQFDDKQALERAKLAARKKGQYYKPPAKKPGDRVVYTEEITPGSGRWRMTNQKNAYSDLYYKLSGSSPTILHEMAKVAGHATEKDGTLKRNLSPDETERFANTLLSRVFEVKVNAEGDRIATVKAGAEDHLNTLTAIIAKTDKLKMELMETQDKQMSEVQAARKQSDKDAINTEYTSIINGIQGKVDAAQVEIDKLLSVNITPEEKTTTTKKSESDLDDYFEEK